MRSHNSYIEALGECKRIDLKSHKIFDRFSTNRKIVMVVYDPIDCQAHIMVSHLQVDQNGTTVPSQFGWY